MRSIFFLPLLDSSNGFSLGATADTIPLPEGVLLPKLSLELQRVVDGSKAPQVSANQTLAPGCQPGTETVVVSCAANAESPCYGSPKTMTIPVKDMVPVYVDGVKTCTTPACSQLACTEYRRFTDGTIACNECAPGYTLYNLPARYFKNFPSTDGNVCHSSSLTYPLCYKTVLDKCMVPGCKTYGSYSSYGNVVSCTECNDGNMSYSNPHDNSETCFTGATDNDNFNAICPCPAHSHAISATNGVKIGCECDAGQNREFNKYTQNCECKAGTTEIYGVCCEPGYTNVLGKCTKCNDNCASCQPGFPDKCTACDESTYTNYGVLNPGYDIDRNLVLDTDTQKCVCEEGDIELGGKCVSPKCKIDGCQTYKSFTGSSIGCETCKNGYYSPVLSHAALAPQGRGNHQCRNYQTGYASTGFDTCSKCSDDFPNSITCNFTTAITCQDSYAVNERGQCALTCPAGKQPNAAHDACVNICSVEKCADCETSADQCNTCEAGFSLMTPENRPSPSQQCIADKCKVPGCQKYGGSFVTEPSCIQCPAGSKKGILISLL